MSVLVISDTSCLIALDKIDQLDLLRKLFQRIITTRKVEEEFGKELPKWIQIVGVKDIAKVHELEAILDEGEASTIALALEMENSLLIIDEKKGRKVAQRLNINIIGTLRVIQMAKEQRLIQSIEPVIDDLQKAGFRFSQRVVKLLLVDEEGRKSH